jgi:hypothetical protein
MGKIKKFLDYITGYTSYQNKLNRMVNRRRDIEVEETPRGNNTMTPEEIMETFSMIKDYLTLISDNEGVQITWPRVQIDTSWRNPASGLAVYQFETNYKSYTISSLSTFIITGRIKISDVVNMEEFKIDFNSCKSQLKSEDFELEWNMTKSNHFGEITVRHISCKKPEPVKRRPKVR